MKVFKKIIAAVLIFSVVLSTVLALEQQGPTNISGCIDSASQDTFMKISGYENLFSVIDVSDDKVFVVSNDGYGIHSFDTSGSQSFDPDKKSSIAYWLNNDFLENGNEGMALPEVMKEYYSEHIWVTEPGAGDEAEDFSFSAKISLLSLTEFKNYKDKIGFLGEMQSEGGATRYWGLRTPSKNNKSYYLAADLDRTGYFVERVASSGGGTVVRPVFYLELDFFKNVKLDTTYMGSDVKKLLAANLSDAELSEIGYSKAEIAVIKNINESTYEKFDVTEIVTDGIYDGNNVSFSVTFECINTMECTYAADFIIDDIIVKTEALNHVQGINEYTLKFPKISEGNHIVGFIFKRDGDKIGEFKTDILSCSGSPVNMKKLKGMAAHFGRTHYTDGDYKIFSASGSNAVRDDVYWKVVETHTGKYDWSVYKERFEYFNNQGIEIICTINTTNPLYSNSEKGAFSSDDEINAYADMLVDLLETFPYIRYIIPQNEPNITMGGTDRQQAMDNYINMIKAVSEKVHKVRPDVKLLGASVATEYNFEIEGSPNTNCDTFINYVLPEIYPYVDGIDMHVYTTPQDCEVDKMYHRINLIKDKMLECGGWKELITSEVGWVTGEASSSVSNERQAYNVVRTMAVMDEADYDGTIIYDFKDDGTDIENQEHNFGLISYNSTPKRSYYALQTYFEETANCELIGMKKTDDNVRLYLYSDGLNPVILMWADEEKTYSFGDSILEVTDESGRKFTATGDVTVGPHPVYVRGVSINILKELAHEAVSKKTQELFEKLSEKCGENAEPKINEVSALLNQIGSKDDYYNVVFLIYDIGEELIELYKSGTASYNVNELGGYLFEIFKTANRLNLAAELYNEKSNIAKEYEILDIEAQYKFFEKTIKAYSSKELPFGIDIYNYGKSILNNLNGQKGNKFVPVHTVNDVAECFLASSGELKTSVTSTPGSYCTLKIVCDNVLKHIETGITGPDGVCTFLTTLDGIDKTYYIYILSENVQEPAVIEIEAEACKDTSRKIQAEYLLKYAKAMLSLASKDLVTADVQWNYNGEKLQAEVSLQNSVESKSVRVIAAKYEKDRMVHCETQADASDKKVFTFEKSASQNVKYSIFVWSDGENMTPYEFVWNSTVQNP